MESTTSSSVFVQNFSSLSEPTVEYSWKVWISDVIICSILAPVSFYLLIALIYYHHRVENRNFCDCYSKSFFQLSSEKKYRMLSKHTCIFIAISSTFRHAFSIVSLALIGRRAFNDLALNKNTSDVMCDILPRLDVVSQVVCMSLILLFMFFIQRTYYIQASYKIKWYRCAKRMSYAISAVYIVASVGTFILWMVTAQYEQVAGICITELKKDPFVLSFSTWCGIMLMAQLLLLLLFLWPMLSMSSFFEDENNEVIVTDNSKRYLKQWQRTTNIEFFYLISNATVGFIVIFWSADQRYSPFISFPFNINLVINNFLAIACFDCWKKRLWPWSVDFRGNPLPMSVASTKAARTVTDFGAHTSIREPRSTAG